MARATVIVTPFVCVETAPPPAPPEHAATIRLREPDAGNQHDASHVVPHRMSSALAFLGGTGARTRSRVMRRSRIDHRRIPRLAHTAQQVNGSTAILGVSDAR